MTEQHSNSSRIYALDLLRSLAIISVILYHFPRPESATWFRAISHYGLWGVDLFFILSGFLIGGQWFRSLKKNKVSISSFYSRRFLRTLPNYYVMLFVVAIIGLISSQQLVDWRYLFFVQNLSPMTTLTHTWSLCVEEHFYLLFPLFGLAVWRKPQRAPVYFAILFLIPLLARGGMWLWLRPDLTFSQDIHKTFWDYHTYIFYPTLTRIDTISLGVALAFIQVKYTELWDRLLLKSHLLLILGLISLGIAAVMMLARFSFLGATISFSFVGIGCALLLVSTLGQNSSLTHFKLPFVNTIALWSYALYLTHLEAFSLAEYLRTQMSLAPYSFITVLLEVVCIIGTAWLLHTLIEKPFLKLRDRLLGT